MAYRDDIGKAGIVLGLGLGGFADGIALHQIVQWHNMGSAVLPPTTMAAMKQNMASLPRPHVRLAVHWPGGVGLIALGWMLAYRGATETNRPASRA